MKLCFPQKVLDQHVVMLGKTGSGKSSALRHIVEHLLDHKKRTCIIDPKGDWWGLKSSADGKGAGYPVIMFGDFKEPKASDVPINAQSGKHVAELISSGNRPCVIGFRGWSTHHMQMFWIDFAASIFARTGGELFLVGDEFHNFAPKGKVLSPQAGESLHWSNRLLSEGRGLGLVCLLASQRPQKVHNDTLTSCETLVAMRVIHKADRDAVKDWLDGAGDPKLGAEVLNSLAAMPRGEAWIWSPEIGYGPERVKFPMFETFDSFAPPQLQKRVSGKGWAGVDLGAVKEKLAAVIEERKAADPKELKKKIAELQEENRKLAAQKSAVATPVKVETKRVEVAVVKPAELQRIERFAATLSNMLAAGEKRIDAFKDLIDPLLENVVTTRDQLRDGLSKLSESIALAKGDRVAPAARPADSPVARLGKTAETTATTGARPSITPLAPAKDIASRDELEGPAKRVLDSLAFWESIGVNAPGDSAVALKAGYSPTSSAYERPRGALRTAGLIQFPNPSTDARQLTVRGRDLAAYPTEAGSLLALHEQIQKVLPGPEVTLLKNLIAAYPRALSNQELAEASGYNVKSSAYERPRGKLRSIGLAEFRYGGVAASAILFPANLYGRA